MGRITRRRFLAAISTSLAPGFVRGQAGDANRVRTIGWMTLHGLDPKFPPSEYASTKALKKLGWIEGQNILIERRFGEYKTERLAEFAQEFVRKRVELIITTEDAPALAAARATRTIPIVFTNMGYPVERGLVDSLARPGRNATGSTWLYGPTQTSGKRLELLREIAPAAKRVYSLSPLVHLETVAGGFAKPTGPGLPEQAKSLGFELRIYWITKADDVDAALADALAWNAEALLGAGAVVEAARDRVAQFALQHKLPSAFLRPSNVEAGGLLSYGIGRGDYLSLIDGAMGYVDRILRGGAKPADLPILQPRSTSLVINLKTAKAIGLTVPRSMLLRADRVIE